MHMRRWRLPRLRRPLFILPVTRKRRLHRPGRRVLIRSLIALALILALFIYSAARVRPVIAVRAQSEAREFVILAINAAISDEVGDGSLEYGKLVTLEKDGRGNITALVTNSALINILQTRISSNVVARVENVVDANMGIPIGSAFGGVLTMGRGPRIPVKIQSVTNVNTRFTNEFSSAGINQTRHKIMLEIFVEIDIGLPGDRVKAGVTSEVAIAETVIVGVVPNVYTDIGRMLE